ncbi:MAG: MerR family transcriptional regulator, partial [bacterium]
SIGDLARLGGVSVRMLRHYDDLGLLRPAEVDEWTGRRRYQVGQLEVLNRIVTLKELGFTLQQVGELIHDGVDAAEVRGMLRMRRAELEHQGHETAHRLAQIDARLRLLDNEGTVPEQDVVIKHVEPMQIAALTDVAPVDASFAAVVEELFVRVCDLMDAARQPRTTPVSRYVPETAEPEDALRVYTGFSVTQSVPGLELVMLPGAEVASAIHHGPMLGVGHAYQTLARWADSHGYDFDAGTPRRRTVFLEANGEDQADWIVEVQLELT